MIDIVCVLKTGPFNKHQGTLKEPVISDLKPEIVPWLKRQVDRHVTVPHRFVCLTDLERIEGVETIRLKHNWPGWWSKIELFTPGLLNDKVLYMDIDTVILQNIDDLCLHPHNFTALDNISHPNCGEIGGGLMAWTGDFSHLYKTFAAEPERFIRECVTNRNWGDQGFIANHLGFQPLRFQHHFPGIHSLRRDLSDGHNLEAGRPRPDTRIVIFNHLPKPWDMKAEWIPK